MWVYEQFTGALKDSEGNLVSIGYSGAGEGKNNPSLQNVKDVGPVPQGIYDIDPPRDTQQHGPYAMPLVPMTGDLFERSGFMIHGDSVSAPGAASEGCVILLRSVREQIWSSGDHQLQVISGQEDVT